MRKFANGVASIFLIAMGLCWFWAASHPLMAEAPDWFKAFAVFVAAVSIYLGALPGEEK